jgi:uncharacterized membrane protein
MWILLAFLAPALYAISEIFDEYLTNRGFKNLTPLVFMVCLFNFIFVPVVFLIEKPVWPEAHLLLPLFGVALTNLLYLVPYYKALRKEDTSVVSAFFSFGKIIMPVASFLLIGEVLELREYVGIGIIILANIFLALHSVRKKIRISKAFFLILLASTLLAIEGILFKYMFLQGMNWGTAVGGQLMISGFFGCVALLLFKKTRKRIVEAKKEYRKVGAVLFVEELFTFLAVGVETYAIMLAPVSLVKGVGMSIPIFVLLFTIVVKKYNPKAFRENTGRVMVIKKIAIFGCIIVGLMLIGLSE